MMFKRLKKLLINYLADILPDSCPFNRPIYFLGKHLFTTPSLCKLNIFYKDVVDEKLRRKGYA